MACLGEEKAKSQQRSSREKAGVKLRVFFLDLGFRVQVTKLPYGFAWLAYGVCELWRLAYGRRAQLKDFSNIRGLVYNS